MKCDSYVFWVEGSNLIKDEHTVDPPNSGDAVEVNLVATAGLELPVMVVGPEDRSIEGATVVARWKKEREWLSREARTGPTGAALVRGVPPGMVYLRAFRDGYSEAGVDPVELSATPLVPIIVRLPTGGRIIGKCVHGSESVHAFELLFWKDLSTPISRQKVWGDPEGIFTIERAPLGDVTVMAISDAHAQSDPELVHVEPGVDSKVVLRFPSTLSGRGRVVDATTSGVIRGARVHVLTHVRGRKIELYGTSSATDEQGEFEIAGLVSERSPVEVSAPGHATRTAFGRGMKDGFVEFGIVPLSSRHALEVRLESVTGRQDFSSFACELAGTELVPDRRFSSDGSVRYDALDAGPYTARILYPGQQTYRDVAFILGTRTDVTVTVPIDVQSLLVRVIPEPNKAIPSEVVLCIHSDLSNGESSCQYYGIPPSGDVDVAKVTGPLVATVETWGGELLGVTHADTARKSQDVIEVRLGKPPRDIRVVDGTGKPLSGVTVYLTHPSEGAEWFQTRQSNAEGRCTFEGLSLEMGIALLHRYPDGYMAGQPVDLEESGSDPIEVLFAPDWDLKVQLMERGVPSSGVDVVTDDPMGLRHLPSTTSDAEGVASIARVSGAGWRVRIAHPGYWPAEHLIGPRDLCPYPIQVRRLGSIEFRLRTSLGVPAENVALDLQSVEMSESVSSWVGTGRARVSNADFRTGTDGRLRFDAVPNGQYLWRASAPSGEVSDGEVYVPAQSTAIVEATTP